MAGDPPNEQQRHTDSIHHHPLRPATAARTGPSAAPDRSGPIRPGPVRPAAPPTRNTIILIVASPHTRQPDADDKWSPPDIPGARRQVASTVPQVDSSSSHQNISFAVPDAALTQPCRAAQPETARLATASRTSHPSIRKLSDTVSTSPPAHPAIFPLPLRAHTPVLIRLVCNAPPETPPPQSSTTRRRSRSLQADARPPRVSADLLQYRPTSRQTSRNTIPQLRCTWRTSHIIAIPVLASSCVRAAPPSFPILRFRYSINYRIDTAPVSPRASVVPCSGHVSRASVSLSRFLYRLPSLQPAPSKILLPVSPRLTVSAMPSQSAVQLKLAYLTRRSHMPSIALVLFPPARRSIHSLLALIYPPLLIMPVLSLTVLGLQV